MSDLTITPPQTDRVRVIPSQTIYMPQSIDLKDYEVFGYLRGTRVDRLEGLSLNHFDQVQFINESTNPITKEKAIHVIGHRVLENRYTVLVLKKK